MNSRTQAALCLNKVLPGAGPNRSLSEVLSKADLSEDEAFIREMCFGVLRWRNRLQAIVNQLLRKPFKPKDSDINWLLLLGLYQLLYLRTPDHAAIGETVEAAKQLKKKWACAVLNGVLRGFQRNKQELLAALSQDINIQTAHPKWLTDKIKQAWPNHWQGILEQNNQQAPMSLRVNTRRTNREHYLRLLSNDDNCIAAKPLAHSPEGIQLEQACVVDKLPHFSDGWVSVQDEAAQLATLFLAPQANDRILDACAAPGGKTCHILEKCPDLKELVAVDISEVRNRRVTENLNRLQLEATVLSADIAAPELWQDDETFDRILLDAPCSATGVIRRHPDIKWLRREKDIAVLVKQQLELLLICWQKLKIGGELLYCTCSILPDENEMVVTSFLALQADAQPMALYGEKELSLFSNESAFSDEESCAVGMGLQLFPTHNGHDGFFYAKFKKRLDNNS
ncbi:MAG: 16S rRNA (cytosine(967)-C(5))-methyltransferase RsmB [Pseudomonadales bacterium]|nr:16S rRNA (cytosine(967)-C(5))-methyltransferase RsmB [Pseudomonadales bacterium]